DARLELILRGRETRVLGPAVLAAVVEELAGLSAALARAFVAVGLAGVRIRRRTRDDHTEQRQSDYVQLAHGASFGPPVTATHRCRRSKGRTRRHRPTRHRRDA